MRQWGWQEGPQRAAMTCSGALHASPRLTSHGAPLPDRLGTGQRTGRGVGPQFAPLGPPACTPAPQPTPAQGEKGSQNGLAIAIPHSGAVRVTIAILSPAASPSPRPNTRSHMSTAAAWPGAALLPLTGRGMKGHDPACRPRKPKAGAAHRSDAAAAPAACRAACQRWPAFRWLMDRLAPGC